MQTCSGPRASGHARRIAMRSGGGCLVLLLSVLICLFPPSVGAAGMLDGPLPTTLRMAPHSPRAQQAPTARRHRQPTGSAPAVKATSISASWGDTCASMQSGEVDCWGEDYLTTHSPLPAPVNGVRGAVTVSIGIRYDC